MFTERDYYNIIETARNDGLAMGMAKGEADRRKDEYSLENEEKRLQYIRHRRNHGTYIIRNRGSAISRARFAL